MKRNTAIPVAAGTVPRIAGVSCDSDSGILGLTIPRTPEAVRNPTAAIVVNTCTVRGSSMPARFTTMTDMKSMTMTSRDDTAGKTCCDTCAKMKLSSPAISTTEIRYR